MLNLYDNFSCKLAFLLCRLSTKLEDVIEVYVSTDGCIGGN